MTDLFQEAIARVSALPAETQDEYARVLLRLAGDEGDVYRLTAEEAADLAVADEEIRRGEFASDEEVRAVFARFAP